MMTQDLFYYIRETTKFRYLIDYTKDTIILLIEYKYNVRQYFILSCVICTRKDEELLIKKGNIKIVINVRNKCH